MSRALPAHEAYAAHGDALMVTRHTSRGGHPPVGRDGSIDAWVSSPTRPLEHDEGLNNAGDAHDERDGCTLHRPRAAHRAVGIVGVEPCGPVLGMIGPFGLGGVSA